MDRGQHSQFLRCFGIYRERAQKQQPAVPEDLEGWEHPDSGPAYPYKTSKHSDDPFSLSDLPIIVGLQEQSREIYQKGFTIGACQKQSRSRHVFAAEICQAAAAPMKSEKAARCPLHNLGQKGKMRGPSAGLSGVHCLRSSEEKPRVRRGIGTNHRCPARNRPLWPVFRAQPTRPPA